MTAINATSNVNAFRGPIAAGTNAKVASGGLLPPPSLDLGGVADVEDALIGFFGEQAKQSASTMRLADAEARGHKAVSSAQNQRAQDEISKRVKAEREAKTFWGKLKKLASSIAKIATTVASAVATVMSAGTAGAFAVSMAALVLSTSGTAIKELKLLGKASDKIGMGLELAGAVASAGSLVVDAAKNAVSGAAKAAGAAAGATGATANALSTVQTTATVIGSATTAASAAFRIKEADCVRDAELAAAEEADARGLAEVRDRQVRAVIETMKAAHEAETDALNATRSAIESCQRATEVAIAGVKG